MLEKLSYGPNEVWSYNPKAIFFRVSGYGQSGKMSMRPGHDLNYLSTGKVLPLLNEKQYVIHNEQKSNVTA